MFAPVEQTTHTMNTSLDLFEQQGGEPWHVTQAEWLRIMGEHFNALGQVGEPDEWATFHRSYVQEALDAGNAVAHSVLLDYPGIRAVSEQERQERYALTAQRLNDLLNKAVGL